MRAAMASSTARTRPRRMAPRDGRRSLENAGRRFRPASAWAIATTLLLLASGFKTPGTAEGGAERDDARGRAADSPSEIPPLGWKDILLRLDRKSTRLNSSHPS